VTNFLKTMMGIINIMNGVGGLRGREASQRFLT
jgi:hypothetical protein